MPKRNIPWYRLFEDRYLLASHLVIACNIWLSKNGPEALENFKKETMARFIYESNNIEKEGLSFGETKELVIEELAKNKNAKQIARIQLKPKFIKKIMQWNDFMKEQLSVHLELVKPDKNAIKKLFPNLLREENLAVIAKYGTRRREAKTVLQHFIAVLIADRFSTENYLSKNKLLAFSRIKNEIKLGTKTQKRKALTKLNKLFPSGKRPNYKCLLTESKIKRLHRIMAKGLINKKHAQAGVYRNHPVMTDLETHYPAWEDVPKAMKLFVKQFNEYDKTYPNPIAFAAWASTQFVKIHPFSDFNSRMSRLILNMILRNYHLPFYVTLKSTRKERKRYFYALRKYQSNKKMIVTLISMQLISYFEDLNSVLSLSGKKKIDPRDLRKRYDDLSMEDIFSLKKFGLDN